MDIEEVKVTASQHRLFLALIASALQVRTYYTAKAMEIFQEELNKAYEPTRKNIEEQAQKEREKATTRINAKEWNLKVEKIFRKAHHNMVTKPLQDKHKEEEKVNRFLYTIMKDTVPDSTTIIMTKCVEEFMKAKDPRDLLTIISMYNKGMFDEALKAINKNTDENNTQNTGNSPAIVDAHGNNIHS